MNQTANISSISFQCDICQISYGFNSADRRSIIVMVILTAIALILCYASVLWFSIRTRYKMIGQTITIEEALRQNEAFKTDEVQNQDADKSSKLAAIIPMTTIVNVDRPTVVVLDNGTERF